MSYPELRGKVVLFLGSSVTEGSGAGGVSFVEQMAERDGVVAYKEAVPGTTLADIDGSSYVQRLRHGRLPSGVRADAFVCQLSTNDAGRKIPPELTEAAIRDIVSYARSTWNCPVFFYTGTRYGSERYAGLVAMLKRLSEELGFEIIDLWDDPEMLAVSPEDYARWMNDPVHPNLTGYAEWWTPKFESFLAARI